MALKALAAALATVLAASPLSAQSDSAPAGAPAGSATTLYCLRVTLSGHAADQTLCWTRDEWADQGVDVDLEWAKNGVRTEG